MRRAQPGAQAGGGVVYAACARYGDCRKITYQLALELGSGHSRHSREGVQPRPSATDFTLCWLAQHVSAMPSSTDGACGISLTTDLAAMVAETPGLGVFLATGLDSSAESGLIRFLSKQLGSKYVWPLPREPAIGI
jgi:hypothetical protein